MTTIAQLRANPIIVPLLDLKESKAKLKEYEVSDPDFSGRVIYSLSPSGLVLQNSAFGFYCGPETKEGYLHDTFDGGVYKKLKQLFADFPKRGDRDGVRIGAAENYHTVHVPQDVVPQALWEIIVGRLSRSGAVEQAR